MVRPRQGARKPMVGDSVRMSARRVLTPGSSIQGNSSEVTIPVTSSSDQPQNVESFTTPSDGGTNEVTIPVTYSSDQPQPVESFSTPSDGGTNKVTIPVISSSDQSSTVESFSTPSEGETTEMVPTPGTSDPNKLKIDLTSTKPSIVKL